MHSHTYKTLVVTVVSTVAATILTLLILASMGYTEEKVISREGKNNRVLEYEGRVVLTNRAGEYKEKLSEKRDLGCYSYIGTPCNSGNAVKSNVGGDCLSGLNPYDHEHDHYKRQYRSRSRRRR